ncbi:MAG: Ig-like domain-containing protein [Lachnospiraceae bacterium]|nr:Ig-like domain-containing protein [Lachnospiraceae bacterium]
MKVNLPRISKKTATLLTGGIVRLKMVNTQKPVTWSTDNSGIAEAVGMGEVTARSAGQAVITATVEGQKYDCTVTVRQ